MKRSKERFLRSAVDAGQKKRKENKTKTKKQQTNNSPVVLLTQ